MKPAIIYNDSFISAIFPQNGKSVFIQKDSKNYQKAIDLIRNENWVDLETLVCPEKKVQEVSNNNIDIVDGLVTYKGEIVHNVVAERINDLVQEKLPYSHLVEFLDNILECDSFVVLNELYLFLESNESMPLTDDGGFLAYRVVNENYLSKHKNPDGSHNSNKIGEVVEMPKNMVDPNRHQTCSYGLHFCSRSYIPFYGYSNSDRVMIVKIFPQDVIAIPSDHENAKGRCCKYEVVGEVENYSCDDDQFLNRASGILDKIAYEDEDEDEDEEDEEEWGDFYDDLDSEDEEVEDDEEENELEAVQQVLRSKNIHVIDQVLGIIEKQIDKHGITTFRRVSKSTYPYVGMRAVKEIALAGDYNVSENQSLSQSTITK